MIVVGVEMTTPDTPRAPARFGADAWIAKDRADKELPRLLEIA